MKKRILSFQPLKGLLVMYVILALAAALQAYVLTVKPAPGEPGVTTKYNNYVIFKSSYFHLMEGKNLYQEYPEEHWDLYKYSPTFALLFGSLAMFPDWLGLTLWNLLNVLIFFAAVYYLPGIDEKKKMWILLLSVADAMTSLQNCQSNLLLAGMLICGVGLFEKKHYFLATLCIVGTVYIKIFGVAALVLLLFYPEKVKSGFYAAFWLLILWLIPAVVTGFRPLMEMYAAYAEMLKHDQSVSLGISVMGWLKSWFGIDMPKTVSAVAGFMLMCLPLVSFRKFAASSFRLFFFSSLLIWMVIFNHKAESPTFIIATSGIFIWYFSSQRTTVNMVLLVLTILFTALSATDIFPGFIRENYFQPYNIKVVPCMLVWIKIIYDLIVWKEQPEKVV